MSRGRRFKLVQEEGRGEEVLAIEESLEEMAEVLELQTGKLFEERDER